MDVSLLSELDEYLDGCDEDDDGDESKSPISPKTWYRKLK